MLQVIFGDDEHTASEGPYSRVMKTRKWLYLGSLALIGIGNGLYDEAATTEALKVVSIPESFLTTGVAIGLVYLIIQYLLLVFQLISTYDITLEERFTFRRADDLQAARDRVTLAENRLDELLEKADNKHGTGLTNREEVKIREAEYTVTYEKSVLERFYARQPSRRVGYKFAESLIDLFRILPPVLLAGYALFHIS